MSIPPRCRSLTSMHDRIPQMLATFALVPNPLDFNLLQFM